MIRGTGHRGRGGFAARGHYDVRSFRYMSTTSQHNSASALPKTDVSQRLLSKFSVDTVTKIDGKGDHLKIKDVEVIGGYNWTEGANATVLIPGKPPRWQPPAPPQQLHEDGGIYYRDPNSARFPAFPTEPAVRAIQAVSPAFDLTGISIFACGNTLGSLLSFARNEDRTFRFGVEMLGDTVFLIRRTNKQGELIEDIRGYGHTFPEAYTSWDREVRGSATHQRIISYLFSGMQLAVRSECDGYLPALVSDLVEISKDQGIGENKDVVSDDDIHKNLLSLALGPELVERHVLRLQTAGRRIPQSAIFDLKTRSIKRKANDGCGVDDFLHRMWVNQTPNMILAYHKWGKFEKSEINIVNVEDKIREWEASNSTPLAKLAGVLQDLKNAGKMYSRFEVRRINNGALELWSEVDGHIVLPTELRSIWTGEIEDGQDQSGLLKDGPEDGKSVESDESDDEDYLKF